MPKLKQENGKIYWKISEVAELMNVATSAIRWWEREFSWIRPKKGKNGQRQYIRKQLDAIIEVQTLLRNGITLKGIRKAHREEYLKGLVEFFHTQEIKNGKAEEV